MSSPIVVDREGVEAILQPPGGSSSEETRVAQLADGRQVRLPAAALRQQRSGRYHTPLSLRELAQSPPAVTVPVIEEQLSTQKRPVTTGVRVEKRVKSREERIELPTVTHEVTVEHVPIGRMVEGPVPVRQEGETTIVPVLEEVAVVEKRWLLREELHITRREVERVRPEQVVLRREELSVEPIERK